MKLYIPYSLYVGARTGNTVSINGVSYTYNSPAISTSSATTITLGTVTSKAITHNTDGTKSIAISGSYKINATVSGTSYSTITASETVALDSIPRGATIVSAPNFNDEENPTITYTNPAGSAVESLQACIGWTGDADIAYRDVSKTGTSYTFNLTTAERTKIRNACTDANSMSLKFYLKTVIGGETHYSRLAKTVTIINANPGLSPTAVEDVNASTDGGDGNGNITATGSNTRWLKGVSDVRYSFGASAKKGATIKSYKVECGSKLATTASGVLYDVDSGTIKFTVTDSRGNTTTQTLTRTLVNYVKPTCNLSASIALDTGETAKATLKISGNCFNGQIKAGTANTINVWFRYKEESGSYGTWTRVTPTLSGNTYSLTYEVPTALNYRNNFTFQARVQDNLYLAYGSYITSGTVTVNALPVFDWGKSDFNFNVPVTVNHNDVGFAHTHTGTGNSIAFGIGASGINRGIYDRTYEKWLVYTDNTNTYIGDANNTYTIGKNNVLWSGAQWMMEAHTVNLSQAVSKQMNGIVLVFSRYDTATSTTLDDNFNYHFIPKQMIALQNNKGSVFNMSASSENCRATKYLYISDTSIKGHAHNTPSGTGATGTKYENAKFVLRYVIGV